jgi:hypothetical protein
MGGRGVGVKLIKPYNSCLPFLFLSLYFLSATGRTLKKGGAILKPARYSLYVLVPRFWYKREFEYKDGGAGGGRG